MNRVERIAGPAASRAAARVEQALREAAPGLEITRDDTRIAIVGRGAGRRMAALRWIGGLLR